jgi:signal transduction histidine kinase
VQSKRIVRTITFRLTLAVSVVFTASVLSLFSFIYWQTTTYETRRIGEVVTTALDRLAQLPPDALPHALEVRQETGPNRLTEVTLFGSRGTPIEGPLTQLPHGLAVDGQVHRLKDVLLDGHLKTALTAAVGLGGGRTLIAARDIGVLVELRHVVIRTLLVGVIPLVLLGLAAGVALSLRTVRRLRMMHEAIAHIMHGNLSERLPGSGTWDDLDRLTHEMNHMLDEIERLVGETKSVGDNIAHDLRTPLTRMRMRFEVASREEHTRDGVHNLIDASIADLDLIFGIVTALLRIGEIESGRRRAGFREIDVAEIAQEVGEIYVPIAEANGLTLDITTSAVPKVIGDHDLFVEAIANLIDNAIKFTPPAGRVSVVVDAAPPGAVLRVIDTGPGIPAGERDLVLRRFYRGGNAKQVPGNGLGLNLVAAIARLHEFQLIIEDGPGCTFALLCGQATRQDTASAAHYGPAYNAPSPTSDSEPPQFLFSGAG